MVQILTPEEVEGKYGRMFCKSFLTLVDEENGIAQIVERCSSQGPGAPLQHTPSPGLGHQE